MCAKQFLLWMTKYFPESVNEWITAHDIEVHLYPMFGSEGGGTRSFLSFVRGLGKVTRKRSCEYIDLAGKRRTRTEYRVLTPKVPFIESVEAKG